MADRLYRKLSSLDLLRWAWHLAHFDTRTDFMFDPLRYADFAFMLEDNLQALSNSVATGTYHPSPLLKIDVPKSTLSVRPGSVISMPDRIVLFAITCLIAPILDKKLPHTVYSWRLKKRPDNRSLFEDLEILKLPFLKSRTIRRRVHIAEPWYGAWPRFAEETRYTFEEGGYRFLAVSDISAYFENISHAVLEEHLHDCLPKKEHKIVHLLMSLLEYWTWPTVHGALVGRGIPQGNAVSSFLGNIYLLPLDRAFESFCNNHDAKYFRYLDDVKVLAKEHHVAREALFLMNEELRKLHLNVQGAKTLILEGPEVKHQLVDERLDKVNAIIRLIQKEPSPLPRDKQRYWAGELKKEAGQIKTKKGVLRDRELRLFRRLLTGFTLLGDDRLVHLTLQQLKKNPDERLYNNAIRYFRSLGGTRKKISDAILSLLKTEKALFSLQEARLLMGLRYFRTISKEAISFARNRLFARTAHPYVRVQAVLLLAQEVQQPRSLERLRRLYEEENDIQVKRALTVVLSQSGEPEVERLARTLAFSSDPRLQSMGRMWHAILFNKERARQEVARFFRDFDETKLQQGLDVIELAKNAKSDFVRDELRRRLKAVRRKIHVSRLKSRVERILGQLAARKERSSGSSP